MAGIANIIINIRAIQSELMNCNNIYAREEKRLKLLTNNASLTNFEIAQLTAQSSVQLVQIITAAATDAAIKIDAQERNNTLVEEQEKLLKEQVLEMKEQVKIGQATEKLTLRKMRGFNDNMLIKKTEYQSNLASFAVNVDSTSAQDAIDRFKDSVTDINTRVIACEADCETEQVV